MTSLAQTRAIHSLRRQISNFTDADYREMLDVRFRVASSSRLNDVDAGRLIDELKMLAGQPAGRAPSRTASGKYAPVLQALWLSGHALGIVKQPDDKALLAFVRRQTGMDHTRFLTDAAEARRAIEALKSWLAREGGVDWPRDGDAYERKRAVLDAVARRMREALPSFDLATWLNLSNFPALAKMTDGQIDRAIKRLGDALRDRRAMIERASK